MKATSDENSRQAAGRSNCYGLLALIFRDVPTPQMVSQLRSPPVAEVLSQFGYDAAKYLAGGLETVTQKLNEAYTHTFIGPGAHVPLYASVHHEGEGQLWGDSTVQVKNFVEKIGLSFRGNWDSIPDHVAIELEMMQRLIAHEAELLAKCASATAEHKEDLKKQLHRCIQFQGKFLRNHLSKWVPRFCDCVIEISDSPFYLKMTELTKSIVLSDIEQITEVPNQPCPTD